MLFYLPYLKKVNNLYLFVSINGKVMNCAKSYSYFRHGNWNSMKVVYSKQ